MRRYVIDSTRNISRLLQGMLLTGVDRVGVEYIRRFGDEATAMVRFGGRWLFLSDRDSSAVFQAIVDQSITSNAAIRACVARAYAGLGARGVGKRLLMNVLHSGLEDVRYAARSKQHGLVGVFFLHDLIPLMYPEYNRPNQWEKHRQRLCTIMDCGQLVVCNSEETRESFQAWAARIRRSIPHGVVASLGAGRLAAPAMTAPIEGPYFVSLGTVEPRKNHLLLLNIWREFAAELGDRAPALVIIGQRGWECEQVVDMLERCQGLRGLVIEKNRCNDLELATWLAHARALLFPSFAEGYGIPLVEALSLGVPVIASTLTVFREIAGDIPDYLEPIDGLGWKRLILDYADPSSVRAGAQRLRMKGYRVPSWDDHFAIVEPEVRSLLG